VLTPIEEAPDLDAVRQLLCYMFAAVELISPAKPFGSGKVTAGILDTHHDETDLRAGQYRLWISLRDEAFDLDSFGPIRAPLPMPGSSAHEGLATWSVFVDALFGPIPLALEAVR
jgi:hypothetical protein